MQKVSLIVVNYNGSGLITRCLKALEGQSFEDFNIVIVDNGSLDDSLYEIKRFLKESSIGSLVKLVPLNKKPRLWRR
jgi:glycosyltransferase involved in cell wall biosynthesis